MMKGQVIVIGGGLSGHTACHTVLEHGGRVLLLEKTAFCGGNSTKATSGINGGGTRMQERSGIQDSKELFEKDTTKSAGEMARPHLIKALTHKSASAVEWLSDEFGLDLSLIGQMGAHSVPRTHRGEGRFPGMMITCELISAFEHECEVNPDRARIITRARATRLLTDNAGNVIGVEYTKKKQTFQEFGCVIIATGGFSADFENDSLLRNVEKEWRKLPMWSKIPRLPSLLDLPTTNGPNTTGDGIKIAMAVGAGVTDLPYVQVHPTGLVDPKNPDSKVKWLAAEAMRGSGGMLIDANGKRFCNELGKRDYVTGKMFENKGPFRLLMNSKSTKEFEWHCEHYAARGVMQKYPCAGDLAIEMGIEPSTLQETFEKYNSVAANNSDPFGKKIFNNTPFTMTEQYFVAIVTPVVHYTMGGLTCDEFAQVYTNKGSVLKGLFGAGEAIGGIHGDNRLGGSSLLDCVVFGRIAGETAAKYIQDSNAMQATVSPGLAPKTLLSSSSPSSSLKSSSVGKTTTVYTAADVAEHNTRGDCWVIIHDKVYDVTEFLEDHPGGVESIVAFAGKDSTKSFDMLHSMDLLEKYASEYEIGVLKAGEYDVQVPSPSSNGLISRAEVAKHCTDSDCWIIIHGKVYNVTSFLNDHPAGKAILLKYGGKDGTQAFDASGHPKDIVSQLGLEHLCIGDAEEDLNADKNELALHETKELQTEEKPPLSQILNLFDFEGVARKTMTQQGWAYYSSGADDEIALRENHNAYHRLWLRPRILVNVQDVDISGTILGYKTSMPVYISACALGRLAHPDGEVCLTKGAAKAGVIQMLPTLASCTLEEMTGTAIKGQVLFMQLYVNHNRDVSTKLIQRAEKQGVKAIFVTVDAPQLGRREKDMRVKFASNSGPDIAKSSEKKGSKGQGTSRAISQFIDPSLCWEDLEWLRGVTSLPIVLKGVQCAEDAILAVEHGVAGIVLSNHGGRQLDFARSSVEVLVEVMDELQKRNMQGKLEVYVDGGIRRGSDVVKAIALGAKAVGLGRPTLYAMAGYGAEGVEHLFNILRDEIEMCLRLIGAASLDQLSPNMVCTKSIGQHIAPVPMDGLVKYLYQPLLTQSKL
eukprot:m.147326 g.147326  ORF g.147326 m.147326 type:complete len:1095 (+) comp13241_c0_seq11:68-3352(+)